MKRLALLLLPLWCPAAANAAPQMTPRTLHTPDVIAPAVLPYLACLYAERGLPLLRASDGSQVAYDNSASDCSAARARAQADAAKLLEGQTVPAGLTAGQFIDETLTDMDAYVASLPMSERGRQQARGGVTGIPVTMEDVVEPAYKKYDECLKTQVSESLVTADTVLGKFKQAMTICAGVRDYAVGEAAKALAAKGWDEARRIQAATSTFAKLDESWLALGAQYRQALIERAARAGKTTASKTDH